MTDKIKERLYTISHSNFLNHPAYIFLHFILGLYMLFYAGESLFFIFAIYSLVFFFISSFAYFDFETIIKNKLSTIVLSNGSFVYLIVALPLYYILLLINLFVKLNIMVFTSDTHINMIYLGDIQIKLNITLFSFLEILIIVLSIFIAKKISSYYKKKTI